MIFQDDWSGESQYFFLKWIREAAAIYFRPSPAISNEEISFGELIVQKPSGECYDMSRRLCGMSLEVMEARGEKFLNVFNRSVGSVIDCWDDDSRSRKNFDHQKFRN